MAALGETTVTRAWSWGLAVLGDPTADLPTLSGGPVTIGTGAVVLAVRHAQDVVTVDGESRPAEATLHVRVLDEPEATTRTLVCDVVLVTPSGRLTLGDAEAAVAIEAGGAVRHRLVVSAERFPPSGLDEAWVDVVPVAED